MKLLDQNKAPLLDALKKHMAQGVQPFHVPAHKHGMGLKEMQELLGANTFLMDLNSIHGLDDLANPSTSIKEAQTLAAELFQAQDAYFLINGASSGVHAMMLSALYPGDKLILPRNSHKSAITGLILSGAIPVYAPAKIDENLGIATVASYESIQDCLQKAPQSAAIFVINPSYYGFCMDIQKIVHLAEEWETKVIVDEAHGGHMLFHPELPMTAMEAGADMSVLSTHKTCGSLTQSALLLSQKDNIQKKRILSILSVLRSSSASYLLMASIDVARKQLAQEGKEQIGNLVELSRYAREEVNNIPGLYAFAKELLSDPVIANFDETKLCIYVRNLGLTGFEVEDILRRDYKIQIELSDLNNILAYLSHADTKQSIDKLITALRSITKSSKATICTETILPPEMPQLIVSPRDAFYSNKKAVPLPQAKDEIAGDIIMSYPPGIPIVCPGERITTDILDYIMLLKERKASLHGLLGDTLNYINILGHE